MDYKRKIAEMKKHRDAYFPVIRRLLSLYNTHRSNLPETLTGDKDMLIILELIDVGYLDPESFIVEKKFGHIAHLIYNGHYPLTQNGEYAIKEHMKDKRRRKIVVGFAVLSLLALLILLLHLFSPLQ